MTECFGQFQKNKKCAKCEYMEACKYLANDEKKVKEQNSHWENGAREYFDRAEDEALIFESGKEKFSKDEMLAFASYLLSSLGDKKLSKIVSAKLQGAESIAEIARREGVSRQAVHKRIGEELSKILGFKQRRLTDSALLSLTPQEFQIIKFKRDGKSYAEIAKMLMISKNKAYRIERLAASKLGLKQNGKNEKKKKS